MRWYFEDYLQNPFDPAPTIANRIEQRLAQFGRELFDSVFRANDDARDAWKEVSAQLHTTRFEVVTPAREAQPIPWELLLEPETNNHLALRCQSFVRVISSVAENQLASSASGAGPIRILLIISRPSDSGEVPFRSVASRLLKRWPDAIRDIPGGNPKSIRFLPAWHSIFRPSIIDRNSAVPRYGHSEPSGAGPASVA